VSFDYTTNHDAKHGAYESVQIVLGDGRGDVLSRYTVDVSKNGSHTFQMPIVARAGYTVVTIDISLSENETPKVDPAFFDFEIDNISFRQLDLSTLK